MKTVMMKIFNPGKRRKRLKSQEKHQASGPLTASGPLAPRKKAENGSKSEKASSSGPLSTKVDH